MVGDVHDVEGYPIHMANVHLVVPISESVVVNDDEELEEEEDACCMRT
jgi:hypothetical protein